MAITNAQQYQQLLAQGGRIGFFKGAQADASAGKGSMSPGTSGTGGQRGGGNGKGRDLDFQQRGMSKKDYDATKGDRDQNFGGRQNIFEKAFDTAKDFLPGGKYSLTGIAARGLRNIFGGPKSFEEKYGYATDYQGTTGPSRVKDFGFDYGNRGDDRPIIPIIPPLETTPKEESTDVVTSAPRIAYRLMNEGGMADDRMPYEGGIMDLESARQMYGLGKLVKKVTKTVKKIAKSPIGKAALIGAAAFGIPGTSIGGLFGRASFGKAATGLFGQQGLGATLAAGKAKFLSKPFTKTVADFAGDRIAFNAARTAAGSPSSIFSMIPGGKVGAGILGASALAGLMTPKAEEEEQAELNPYLGEGLDIADIRSRPRFYQGQAYRLMSNGGDTEDAKTEEPDLSKDPNYKGWVKIYETNPDLAEMNENHSKYLQFYNKKAEGGSMKEPVAKKTMPLLDLEGQEMDFRQDGGFVPIGRMEKADDVPARLSKNEFVFTAEAVRNAGDGDVDKGAEVMYNMMKNLESGGDVSEESQGLEGARKMFQTSQRLEEVL